jgi:hypothetical protein
MDGRDLFGYKIKVEEAKKPENMYYKGSRYPRRSSRERSDRRGSSRDRERGADCWECGKSGHYKA